MRVLVVDDKKENICLLETMLRGSGYEVVSAVNGMEALERLHTEDFDMVISDILMPVMDGFQLCRECREDNNLKGILFVFYTATYTDVQDEKLAVRLGADRFIRKPAEPDEFLEIIQSLVRDAEQGKVERNKHVARARKKVFKLYSERLVNKLEKKMLSLEGEITRRQKAEEELRKHRDHLEELVKERTAELEMANKQIRRQMAEQKRAQEELQNVVKLESISILAGGVAHDFNNILTGIMGNVTLAKRYVKPGEKVFDRLLEAEKACLRARDLTQQLLTFSKSGTPVRRSSSIAALLKESASFNLRGSGVRCEFSLPDDLWPVQFDEGQMNQVISNLIINAVEAMLESGVLNIRVKNAIIEEGSAVPLPEGRFVEIAIEDQGIGIPEENLDKIFDPYFTTKRKGSGLGLATAYSIIKSHSGNITVTSELNVGTTFCIYLPAAEKSSPSKKEPEMDTDFTGRGRILVMDDEEMIREMLGRMLTLDGYKVELASDGAEAVERYVRAREQGQPFAAVILDLTVPGGMGGKEAIKKLIEVDPGVKTIVSSGYSNDPIVADFGKYGFKGVATKPYAVTELEKTLRNVLRSKKSV